jgi:triphosphatase
MTTPKELDIKLEFAPKTLRILEKIPLIHNLQAALKRATEVSVYFFDTPKRKLHKKGLLLRVRRIGDRYTQTIKASAASRLFERAKWEAKLGGAQPDLSLDAGTALEPLTNQLRRQLKPLFPLRLPHNPGHEPPRACAINGPVVVSAMSYCLALGCDFA